MIGPEEVRRLLDDLRAHPEDFRIDRVGAVVARTGLPEGFVREALSGERQRWDGSATLRQFFVALGRGIRRASLGLFLFFSRRASWTVAIAAVAVFLVLDSVVDATDLLSGIRSVLGLALPMVGLQLGLIHRKGRVSLAWIAGGAFATSAVIADAITAIRTSEPLVPLLGEIGASLLGGLVYALLLAPAAVLGAAADRKRRRRALEELNRESLLERYFELGARLERPAVPVDTEPKGPLRPFVRWPILTPLLAIAGLRGLHAAIGEGSEPFNDVVGLAVTGSAFLTGLAGGGLREALRRIVLPVAVLLAVELLPFRGGTIGVEEEVDVGLLVLVAGLGAAVAGVIRHERRDAAILGGDPGPIAHEMARIDRLLSASAGETAVLVVDVAGSTTMKRGEDPLAIEFSFGAYQRWVERTVLARGGRLVATAGDGAVATLPTAEAGRAAAEDLQRGIGTVPTRLATPFRVRVGVHYGEAHGRLGEVQYTDLIDVAAHVQDEAPIGGFAITEAVASRAGTEGLSLRDEPVDGHRVWIGVPGADSAKG